MRFLYILFAICLSSILQAEVSLDQKIGSMIMVGFDGVQATDRDVKKTLKFAEQGLIGGVIFFAYNIKNPTQVQKLTKVFRDKGIFVAVDQEGGRVQRLSSKNGFRDFLSPQELSKKNANFAELHYAEMANQTKDAGFNMNFGPVVDLYDKDSAVIGKLKRSFGCQPRRVAEFAKAFINSHRAAGIITCLKHFPGHGFAHKDSHKGLVDVTNTYKAIEQEPFELLKDDADMVMTAHIVNQNVDAKYPATLSEKALGSWRKNYNGVMITDDLHMGAIGQHYKLEEIVVKTIQAGNDILLFSNNRIAAGGVKGFKADSSLAEKIIMIVKKAIEEGTLSQTRIEESYQRIQALKAKVS